MNTFEHHFSHQLSRLESLALPPTTNNHGRLGSVTGSIFVDTPSICDLPEIELPNTPIFDGAQRAHLLAGGRPSSSVTNTDQTQPIVVLMTAIGVLEGQSPMDPSMAKHFLEGVSTTILANGTICQLADHQQRLPITSLEKRRYIIDGRSFYQIFAQGGVPALDVHDIAHHGMQFSAYPEFYGPLFELGHAHMMDTDKKDKKMRAALSLLSYATAEYSVVGNGQDRYTFGCLNWQSPRKSPLTDPSGNRFRELQCTVGDITYWNTARGATSLYRRTWEKKRPDIFNRLGYELSPALMTSVQNGHDPFEGMNCDDRLAENALHCPDDPQELFGRALTIMNNL
jgi:hypothetical protein